MEPLSQLISIEWEQQPLYGHKHLRKQRYPQQLNLDPYTNNDCNDYTLAFHNLYTHSHGDPNHHTHYDEYSNGHKDTNHHTVSDDYIDDNHHYHTGNNHYAHNFEDTNHHTDCDDYTYKDPYRYGTRTYTITTTKTHTVTPTWTNTLTATYSSTPIPTITKMPGVIRSVFLPIIIN